MNQSTVRTEQQAHWQHWIARWQQSRQTLTLSNGIQIQVLTPNHLPWLPQLLAQLS